MDNFSGPLDMRERERLGNQRRQDGIFDERRGPLDDVPGPSELEETARKLERYIKIDEMLGKVDSGILEVEQHSVDLMKKEAGASNLKLLAEALSITRTLERRKA